jgi:dynein heavy chain
MDWKAAVTMMGASGFLDEMKSFNARKIQEQVLKNVDDLIALPSFDVEALKRKSAAAASLADWVVNTVMYHKMFMRVAPLLEKVQEAEAQLPQDAEEQIATLQKQISEGEKECDRLEKGLQLFARSR